MKILAFAFSVLFSFAAFADDVAVTGDAITDLLSEKTAIGTWGDDEYRQFFGEDGVTYYAPKGSRSSRGRWRVSADGSKYESWWERSGWAGYAIVLSDGSYFWEDSRGTRYPFMMVEGQQLVWE